MSINHKGLETNNDSNTVHKNNLFRITETRDTLDQIIRQPCQRQTFWKKNRNLLFLVAGLIVGCIVTVVISYAFFSLGRNKGHGNCQPYDHRKQQYSEESAPPDTLKDKNNPDRRIHYFRHIFVACIGNNKSVLDTWKRPDMGGDISNITDSCTNRHLRSTMIDNWDGLLIDQVKVELFRNGQLAVEMYFDGRGSTSKDWFSRHRIQSNSFKDLMQQSNFRFFAMDGDQTNDRHFFIHHNYGSCPNDKGWMVIVDTADADYRPCKFDKLPGMAYPYILYGSGRRMAQYDIGLYAVADMMIISIST